jgi:hypothetical protein
MEHRSYHGAHLLDFVRRRMTLSSYYQPLIIRRLVKAPSHGVPAEELARSFFSRIALRLARPCRHSGAGPRSPWAGMASPTTTVSSAGRQLHRGWIFQTCQMRQASPISCFSLFVKAIMFQAGRTARSWFSVTLLAA